MNDEIEDSREARLDEVALDQFADILRVGKLSINGACTTWECHGLCKEDQLKNYKHAFRERLDASDGITCKTSGKPIFLEALEKRVLWFWVMKATSINFALFEVMMALHTLLNADRDPYLVVTLETYHRKNGENLMSYSFNVYKDRMEVIMYWKKQKDNIYLVNPITATRAKHGFISEVLTSFPIPLEPVILPTYFVKGRARRKGRIDSDWNYMLDLVTQCCYRTHQSIDELLHIRENLSHLAHLSCSPSILDVCLKPEPVCESIPEASEAGHASESPITTVREVNVQVKRRPLQRSASPASLDPSMVESVEGRMSASLSGLRRRWAPMTAKKSRASVECTLPILLGDMRDPFKSGASRLGDVLEPYGGMQSGGSTASNAEPRPTSRSGDLPRMRSSPSDGTAAAVPSARGVVTNASAVRNALFDGTLDKSSLPRGLDKYVEERRFDGKAAEEKFVERSLEEKAVERGLEEKAVERGLELKAVDIHCDCLAHSSPSDKHFARSSQEHTPVRSMTDSLIGTKGINMKFSLSVRDTQYDDLEGDKIPSVQKLRNVSVALPESRSQPSLPRPKAKPERIPHRDVAPARSPGPRELTVAAYYDSLAQSGDPTGMLILGQMCYYDVFSGIRIPQRMEKAKWYFERAAQMGHADAAYWVEKAEQVIDGRAAFEQDLSSDQGSTGTGLSVVPWLSNTRSQTNRDEARRGSLDDSARPQVARTPESSAHPLTD